MKNYFFLFIVFLPSLIWGQIFSVESNLNSQHALSERDWSKIFIYCKNNLECRRKAVLKNPYDTSQIITISIPDTISESYLRINKGEYVTQIYDCQIIGNDTISRFEAEWRAQAGENVRIYFKLSSLFNRHLNWWDDYYNSNATKYYFHVIGPKNVKITASTYNSFNLDNNDFFIPIFNYFLNNKNYRTVKQILRYNWVPDSNLMNIDTFQVRLQKFCDLRLTELDVDTDSEADYILEAHPKDWRKGDFWDFSFIFVSSIDSLFLIEFSYFEFAFEIGDKIYFLFRQQKPETGMHGRNLYIFKKENNCIECIFSDWSWSN